MSTSDSENEMEEIKNEIKLKYKNDFENKKQKHNDNKYLKRKTKRNNSDSDSDNDSKTNSKNSDSHEKSPPPLKNKDLDIKIQNNSNPINIRFLYNITRDSSTHYFESNHTFVIFFSIENVLAIVYTNRSKSILCFNILDNKKMNEIKNAHTKFISNFRHYSDVGNRRDLIISISSKENNIKIWHFQKFDCLANIENLNNTIIKNINKVNYYLSASFINENNKIYIITGNDRSEPLKIFNIKGKKIKEINNSLNKTVFIDTYYDKRLAKNFIILGNLNNVKSYDYSKNKIYHKYGKVNNHRYHFSLIIDDSENVTKLYDSTSHGNIKIWNFHTGIVFRK